MSFEKKNFNNALGFTLIELLIVIGLMAMLMGLAVGFLGNTFSTQVKKQSTRFISTVKFAYNQSTVTGRAHRLVFDIDEQAYWLEEGPEKIIVSANPEDKKNSDKKSEIKEKADTKEDKEDQADTEESDDAEESEEPAQPASEASFSPVDSDVVKKVKLGETVFLRDVFVSHQSEVSDSGLSYLYFFPTGLTEFAVVHLSNEEQTQNYSLIINPLTGSVKVENEYVEYESLLEK